MDARRGILCSTLPGHCTLPILYDTLFSLVRPIFDQASGKERHQIYLFPCTITGLIMHIPKPPGKHTSLYTQSSTFQCLWICPRTREEISIESY